MRTFGRNGTGIYTLSDLRIVPFVFRCLSVDFGFDRNLSLHHPDWSCKYSA